MRRFSIGDCGRRIPGWEILHGEGGLSNMNSEELKKRTKLFALRVVKLVDVLPKKLSSDVMARQLLRAATSVAANNRAACRARSKAEFIAKLGIVEEEADECRFWLEMLIETGLMAESKLSSLLLEANELTAIVVTSIKTARHRGTNPLSALRPPQSP